MFWFCIYLLYFLCAKTKLQLSSKTQVTFPFKNYVNFNFFVPRAMISFPLTLHKDQFNSAYLEKFWLFFFLLSLVDTIKEPTYHRVEVQNNLLSKHWINILLIIPIETVLISNPCTIGLEMCTVIPKQHNLAKEKKKHDTYTKK